MAASRARKICERLVLCALLAVSASAEQTNSARLGFGLPLPPNWFEVPVAEVENLGLGDSAVFATDDSQEQCVIIASREQLAGRPMKAFILSNIYKIYNAMAGYVISEEDLAVAGDPAYRLVYEAPTGEGGEYRKYQRILIVRGDFLFTFQTSTSMKEFTRREGVLKGLLSGLLWSTTKESKGLNNE